MSEDQLERPIAWWQAANYLTVAQIDLRDNPLGRNSAYVVEHLEDMPEIRDWTWPG